VNGNGAPYGSPERRRPYVGRSRYKPDEKPWIVLAPLTQMMVKAPDEDAARQKALVMAGYGSKPYLARDWVIRPATEAEVTKYATWVDNRRPSQTQERQFIETRRRGGKPRRTTQQRLI
jgi:hypothetical protein